ncbi:pantothenate kinase 2-like [Pyrus ussuriensis x Pyrus communis]|uniref:Pantothenate kinase 2-like n=1 Tax=Pyrus ussuriensis x Pyrus communis TaxID=2448454 RepID=A0A5N5H0L4_9ROSA|nr:pantothenate kinase 2-like [Pyrus ussuriensis x Pyrus communis]
MCFLIKLVYFSTNSDDSSSSNESLVASNGDRGHPILEGKLHFAKFETQKINDCIDFIRSKQLRLIGSQQHGASGSTTCIIKATCGGAFKYADLFKEKLGISLDKADEMDCLVAGANFLLKLDGGYLFGLPVGIVADSIGSTLGAGAAFLLGRTVSAADDQIQVIEMIKLLETRGSKTF